jgi:hypothetical protein
LWFDPDLAGLFITSTLLHLGEDINLLVVSIRIVKRALDDFVGLLRLVTNPKKSHIFLSGVDDELQISL